MATQELLENLLSWLQWAETTLTEKDKEALPQEIEEIKALITEHQVPVIRTKTLLLFSSLAFGKLFAISFFVFEAL